VNHEPHSALTFLRSGRTRILLAYVVLLAVSLGVAGVLVRTVLVASVGDRVEAELRQEVEELQRLVDGNDPRTGEPFDGDVRAIFDTFFRRNVAADDEGLYGLVDGAPYVTGEQPPVDLTADPAFVERVSALTAPARGDLVTPAGTAEYLAVPLSVSGASGRPEVRGVFVVAEFPDDRFDRVDDTMVRIGFALLLVLALASAGAYAIAGRLLAPLRRTIDTARTIHEDDLSARVPVSGDDEIAGLARAFNAMLDRVEEAVTAQRDFVSDAGHELRTPLTIARGHLELLTDDPADRAETVALVLDELDRMARLVQDLLLLSRSEQPDFLELVPVDVDDLVPVVFAKATALADRRWIYDGDVSAVVHADSQRLTQALLQLAQNAVQHTRPGDLIAVGATSRDGEVLLWVRDEGDGVAEVDRERIFQRFARSTSQPRGLDGHGLGLAIVDAIVTGHGGRIELDTELGRGSTFRLVLPVDGSSRAGLHEGPLTRAS